MAARLERSLAALLPWLDQQRPARAMLPGLSMIDPIQQGEYDGLCGLYCIINGIRLVAAPHKRVGPKPVRSLFETGIQHIARNASLARAVRRSVGKRLWPSLTERLATRASQLLGMRLLLDQPLRGSSDLSAADILAVIEASILRGRAPLVFTRGLYRHYSCVAGYTPTSLRLFDSYGYEWLRRASCGAGGDKRTLHRFHVESLITVAAE